MKKTRNLFLFWFFISCQLIHAQHTVETIIQQGHPASVNHVAISPDGKLLATASKDKTIKLWDINTGHEIRTFTGHQSEVVKVAFSPDGNTLASSSWDHTVRLWDLLAGKERMVLEEHEKLVSAIDFHPGGERLVSVSVDRTGRIWDLSENKTLLEFTVDPGQYGPDINYSPDGKWLGLGNDDGEILILNSASADTLFRVRELEYSSCGGCYTLVEFSPDMKYILTAADKGPLVIWEMQTGEKVDVLAEKIEDYRAIGFTRDMRYIYAADEEQVYIWDHPEGRLVNTFRGHEKAINSAIEGPGVHQLITGSDDNSAILWDFISGEKVRVFQGILTTPPENGLDLDPDNYWESYPYQILRLKNRFILDPNTDRMVKSTQGIKGMIWDWKAGRKVADLEGHQKSIICYEYSPDGKYLVTGGGDNVAILRDAATGDSIRSFKGHRYVILDVAFSPDGSLLATAGYDGYFMIWEVATGEVIQRVRIEKEQDKIDSPYSIAFTPNGTYVVTGSLGGRLTMWEIDSGEEYISFVGHTRVVPAIVFTPDKKYMLTASWDNTVKMWDYRTGFLEKKFTGHVEPVNDVFVTSDGKHMVTSSTDRTAILWDMTSGEIKHVFKDHKSAVTASRITADGKYLLTGTIDDVVRIWDLKEGQELLTQYFLREDEYMIKNPAGYFYATELTRNHVHFVRGIETYEIDQFFEDFFKPDLVQAVFSADRSIEEGYNLIDKLQESPPPEIEISFPESGSRFSKNDIDVLLKVTNKGGGIDQIKLMHNGKRLSENRAGLERSQKKDRSLYQTYGVKLIPGQNTFRASAFSRERIESLPAESTVIFEGSGNPANCYIVATGINKYRNPQLNLNYARADAENFAEMIKNTEGKLFEKVETHILIDKEATRENLLAALEDVAAKADPSDVFFFFYAGHGSMVNNQFYFIPTECVRLYDENSIEREAVNALVLQEKFKNIQALKQVVIVDACQSGGSAELLAQRGAVDEKAIAQLSRSAGVHVMASAGSEQFATEFKELGHGLFTYVLLQALSGKADGAPRDGKVTIFELKSYLDSLVPELSEKYKGRPQYPYTFSRGHDFPLILNE